MERLMNRAASFILLLSCCFKVAVAVDRNDNMNKLAETLKQAQAFDKAYVYRELLQPTSSDTTEEVLKQLTGQAYKELCCSYAFSSILHLRYTKAYLNDPDNLKMMSTADVQNILFIEESAAMLAIMHDHNEWNQWNGLVDIMWIFRVYTDNVVEFIRRYRDGDMAVSKFPVLRSHLAVEKLFRRFVNSNECKAYDPVTYEPVDIDDVYKTGIVEPFGLANAILATENKRKFRQQTLYNHQEGLTVSQEHRFTEVGLRLNDLMDRSPAVVDALQTAFGVQLDWRPLVKCLEDSYRQSAGSYVRLAQHFEDLTRFQNDFLTVLKIVFMRIVAKHLTHIKLVGNTRFVFKYLVLHYHRYNAKMLSHLKEFVRYMGLSTDRHFHDIAGLLNKPYWSFCQIELFDGYITRIVEFQKEAAASCCSGKVPVESTPTVVNDDQLNKQSIAAVEKVAKDFELDVSNYRMILYPIKESLLAAEVFVKFVKKVTNTVDFGVIHSFGLVNKTETFKQLFILEL